MVLSTQGIFSFFFIVARVAGLFLSAPILSDRSIPQTMKLAMVVWISLLFWFMVPPPALRANLHLDIILLLLGELILGLVIGLISRIIFVGIQMAGSLMDMQMGLSAAATFDPSSGGQVTIMERLMFYFAITIFFLSDAHHLLIVSIFESFKVIPLATQIQYSGLLEQLTHLAAMIFLTGLDLSMPILVIIFLLDFSLGLLARLAPQVNVFSLGFQVKPILGLWIFIFTIPLLTPELQQLVTTTMKEIYQFLARLKVI